jgi:hypothetical protein
MTLSSYAGKNWKEMSVLTMIIKILVEFFGVVCFNFLYPEPEPYFDYGSISRDPK